MIYIQESPRSTTVIAETEVLVVGSCFASVHTLMLLASRHDQVVGLLNVATADINALGRGQ
jgi:hypothetical protein